MCPLLAALADVLAHGLGQQRERTDLLAVEVAAQLHRQPLQPVALRRVGVREQ